VDQAEAVAWEVIENLAADAREDRQRKARIRREHTEKYFEYRIDDLEDRIERFEERDTQPDEDMRIVLAKAQSQLEQLKKERDAELARLEEEKQVIPDEPELINMAVVIDAFES
jgi:TolA-binding protein